MRCLTLLSVLTSVVGLILSVLLIVAGNKPGFLEDLNIITLNTTNVGATLATSPNSPLYSAVNNPAVTSLLGSNPTASAVAGELGSLAQSVAEDIGLHEWYSLHLLDYCEGNFNPNGNVSTATKTITRCSNATAFWNFNLTDVLQSELKPGVPVSALNIPQNVLDDFNKITTVLRVMVGLYAASAGVQGVGILTGIAATLLDGRGSACLNVIWSTIGVLVAVAASVVSTIIMSVALGAVNATTKEFGAVATKGDKFLAMTWGAVAVIALGWLIWVVDCCVGGSRKHQRRHIRYQPAHKEVY